VRLQLITLAGVKVDHEVYEVVIPTVDGEIGVFPDHEPLVSVAKAGVISIRYNKDDGPDDLEYFAIGGGIIEITVGLVRILVDEADHGDDIIAAETEAALERALHMRDTAADQIDIEKSTQLIDRHAVRLKVADLNRRRRR